MVARFSTGVGAAKAAEAERRSDKMEEKCIVSSQRSKENAICNMW